jgi:hypothetical protein
MTNKERLAIPPLTHYTPGGESRVDIVKRLLNPPPPLAARLLGWLKGSGGAGRQSGRPRQPWRRRHAGSSA